MSEAHVSTREPTTTYPTIVGRVIANARGKAGLRQADLAQAVGLTQSAWSRIERGETAINIEQLARAAHRMKLQPNEIVRRADAAAKHAKAQGVKVLYSRPESKGDWLPLLGVVAVGALVAMVVGKGK